MEKSTIYMGNNPALYPDWCAVDSPRRVYHQREYWQTLAEQLSSVDVKFMEIPHTEAAAITSGQIHVSDNETYYFEPEVFLFDPPGVLHGLSQGLRAQGVTIMEHTTALRFDRDALGRVNCVYTDGGEFSCDYLVNAAGAWSPALFAPLGIKIPIKMEPVLVVDWLLGASSIPEDFPIIADFTNLAYFRPLRGPVIHMHQPRRRPPQAAAIKLRDADNADAIYHAGSHRPATCQIDAYREKLTNRFPSAIAATCVGAYNSYFDVTPDLKFVLGNDPDVPNLVHCLGGGQAFKYAPVFGEMVAHLIVNPAHRYDTVDLSQFSVRRFRKLGNFETFPRVASANAL